MNEKLLNSLQNIDKAKIVRYTKNGWYASQLNDLIQHMMKEEKNTSWRAAWIVGHLIKENDSKIETQLPIIIKSIKGKSDGHQRELIKIVRKMQLDEENEGLFFDVCMEIWQDVKKQPALRFYCGLFILEMSNKYPEIKDEIKYLTSDYYTQSLSAGIRRIFIQHLHKTKP